MKLKPRSAIGSGFSPTVKRKGSPDASIISELVCRTVLQIIVGFYVLLSPDA